MARTRIAVQRTSYTSLSRGRVLRFCCLFLCFLYLCLFVVVLFYEFTFFLERITSDRVSVPYFLTATPWKSDAFRFPGFIETSPLKRARLHSKRFGKVPTMIKNQNGGDPRRVPPPFMRRAQSLYIFFGGGKKWRKHKKRAPEVQGYLFGCSKKLTKSCSWR